MSDASDNSMQDIIEEDDVADVPDKNEEEDDDDIMIEDKPKKHSE